MRLIDADAHKQRLIKRRDEIASECKYGWEWEYNGLNYAILLTECEAIENQIHTEPHWIPVTERLPDKEEKSYWVCLEGGGQCQCRWTNDMYGLGANEWSKWGWHVMDKPQYSVIAAWMPLPEPYKGVTE